jgi:two-component system, OmpR family, sensor histidine kinase MprB
VTAAGPTTKDAARWRRPRAEPSLQRRVGRFALVMVALAVLVTGLGGYVATRIAANRAVDRVLVTASGAGLRTLGPAPDHAAVARYLASGAELGTVVLAVVQGDGQVFGATGPDAVVVQDRDVAVATGRSGPTTHRATALSGADYRVRVVPVGQASGLALLVGRPLAGVQGIFASLALALVAFGLIAVAAAGLLGRRVARVGVEPVLELTGEVERRAAEDDLEPVGVSSMEEIGRLAVAFNRVLDSVRLSRGRQVRFVADAGHELRTPLTSMRTNIDLLAADSDKALLHPADRLAILQDVRGQLVTFSTLVSDLIGLTRDDKTSADFDEVDLTAVLEEAVNRVSLRFRSLRWDVDLEPVSLPGDADLLARAFANVLDNAVKYSPLGGTVTVTLRGGVVRIGDEGAGVSPEDRLLVFDRFFRSEVSRATPGTGLGLSITESVVRQHGGTVAVVEAPGGGALFVLTFPAATVRSGPDEASGLRWRAAALGSAGVQERSV